MSQSQQPEGPSPGGASRPGAPVDPAQRWSAPAAHDDAEAILRQYLDEKLAELGPLKEAAQRLLEEQMIDAHGNRTLLTEQEARAALPEHAATAVLERLEEAAVLRAEEHQGGRYFELGHDWLAKKVFEVRKAREDERTRARVGRERRRLIRIAALAVAAAVLLGGLLYWSLNQRRAARDALAIVGARELMARSEWADAASLLLDVDHPEDRMAWLETALELANESPLKLTLEGHEGRLTAASFSPDGKRVVTSSWDGSARVWDLDGSGSVRVLRAPKVTGLSRGLVLSAAWSPDGKRIVTADSDGTARVWDLDGPAAPVELAGHLGDVQSAAFSPDGRRILTTSSDSRARIWNADGTGSPRVLGDPQHKVASASWSPDGNRVATLAGDGAVRVWTDSQSFVESNVGAPRASSVAWSPDGKRIVTAADDGTVRLSEVDGSGRYRDLRIARGKIRSASFSPDGKRIVAAPWLGLVVVNVDFVVLETGASNVLDLVGSSAILTMTSALETFRSVSFSPDGKWVVAASGDRACLWQLDGPSWQVQLRGHKAEVETASFSPDGKRVLTASNDQTARVWALGEPGTFGQLRGHRGSVLAASFGPAGKQVVTASDDQTARLWDLDGSGRFVAFEGHLAAVTSASISPDGRRLLTGSLDQIARVWDLDEPAKVPLRLEGHQGGITAACFSPDGKQALTASEDGTTRVWDLDGAGRFVQLRSDAAVVSAAFSPDGQRIAAATTRSLRVWKRLHDVWQEADSESPAGSGRTSAAWRPDGELTSVAWSPDSKRLVLPTSAGVVYVSNADHAGSAGGPPAPLVLHASGQVLTSAAFSPDGRRIVAGSAAGTVLIWRADGTDAASPALTPAHRGKLSSVAFSPDGKRIVTASDDETARVLTDIPTLEKMLRPASPGCLPERLRQSYLDETSLEAAVRHWLCERSR
jgi:WD40 repeat protein